MEERKFETLASIQIVNTIPAYPERRPPVRPAELRSIEYQKLAIITLENLHQRLMRFIKEQSENDKNSSQ